MKGIIYTGGELTDLVTLARLPVYLQAFLREQNGVVAYFGGLHIRGCVAAPGWHSLAGVWQGERALWRTYTELKKSDIPFAQDCAGNQFLLRGDAVLFLDTETGELADLDVDFKHFLFGAGKFPLEALGMEPLRAFQQAGGVLRAGQLLSLYPPLCIALKDHSKAAAKAVAVTERLAWLARFHEQIKHLPDGQPVQFDPL
ncbi:SMI1/KNR4 family protein [Hymenobacter rubripertinctus]|uniref:SMI1/KNR4 family protein n=1 Tax=Hymenobacter rubripertinctus TaxID=2029981 RepID=A0A418QPZ1_9BACT|nr:SMI1/KNR4 family protein [Hymenobacter rubripertinctus]RIY07263.1 hypothetical protein D0T11_17125 [Hymenobacter rubripertinctus]